MIRKLIPKVLKLHYRLYKRKSADRSSGFLDQVARTKASNIDFKHGITVTQPIKKTSGSANKVHNIKLAFEQLENLIIKPNEVFSYWHFIPHPNASNGFKKGRNLLAGKLQEDYGGGLCQLSGMLYIALLKAGLEITERHNHSIDIYTEATRYTPLGSDATVVYGYKDLRFKNNLDQNISFKIDFKETELDFILCSDQSFKEHQINWKVISTDDFKTVETRNKDGQVLAISRYKV